MSRDRSFLGTPMGVDGPWLAAILAVLDDIHDAVNRLADQNKPKPVKEPAPAAPQPHAVPVSEPAPDGPPEDDGDDGRPVKVAEPATFRPPPPRAGRGASAEAWRAWADAAHVAVPDDASRDDIIAACERAGVLEAK